MHLIRKKIILIYFIAFFSLECGKDGEHGLLGIQVPVGDGKVSESSPFIVTGVYMDSPAYKEGIKPDDIIIQINDIKIENGMVYDHIYKKLLLGRPGEKVRIIIKRKDKQLIFHVTRSKKF